MLWFNKYLVRDLDGLKDKVGEVKEGVISEESWVMMLRKLLSLLPEPSALTPREVEITGFLLKGYNNERISKELFISTNTHKVHTRHIYRKFGVAT